MDQTTRPKPRSTALGGGGSLAGEAGEGSSQRRDWSTPAIVGSLYCRGSAGGQIHLAARQTGGSAALRRKLPTGPINPRHHSYRPRQKTMLSQS
ncbi:hypothetical protein PCANC_13507 [Puccinia coronata f. sp. avenae]|uniref:Uncharacterized protein n=1 Tax=Puccinia coronata f. sp. avenae TaxID=200324 RepID=A0A2N5V4Q9_9BASI|nr:hypothetical protein PCASD_12600 [Puccinia coronata f. sp. avenae]PLW44965.1 hypothetical protein PCANC_13507 [Puccinia coronata f. sp. avenae]